MIFEYEKFPPFYFSCGRIGHGERLCKLAFEFLDGNVLKRYDTKLGALLRGMKSRNAGSQWLLAEPRLIKTCTEGSLEGVGVFDEQGRENKLSYKEEIVGVIWKEDQFDGYQQIWKLTLMRNHMVILTRLVML